MGVKHGRDYEHILNEMTEAVGRISDCYIFFEMDTAEWQALSESEREEVQEALAEDLFFALGTEPVLAVGSAEVIYDAKGHRIRFMVNGEELTSVSLV